MSDSLNTAESPCPGHENLPTDGCVCMDSGIYDESIEFSLAGKRIAFVGRLEGMSRKDAAALVRSRGAKVSRKLLPGLNLIIIGDRESVLLEGDGWLSDSLIQAVDAGNLKILSETQLWELLDREKTAGRASGSSAPPLSRLFTPSMLASMLELPVTTIRNWNKLGLIRPARQVKKLPYYDLNEVASAKTLAQALHSGISPVALRNKIEQLSRIIPSLARSMDQLSILVSGPGVLFRRADNLMDATGQLHFDLKFNDTVELSAPERSSTAPDSSSDNGLPVCNDGGEPFPSAGFLEETGTQNEGVLESSNQFEAENRDLDFGYALDQALLQSDFSESCPEQWDATAFRKEIAWLQQSARVPEALAAARLMVGRFGPTADDCVLLGELLYQQGDKSAARERYYMALELDESNLEARLYLGCLLAEEGDLNSAAAALNGCLSLHPDYPDAHFQLATVLDNLGKPEEARIHWLAFWNIAPPSPWKRVAAQRLGFQVDWEDEGTRNEDLS